MPKKINWELYDSVLSVEVPKDLFKDLKEPKPLTSLAFDTYKLDKNKPYLKGNDKYENSVTGFTYPKCTKCGSEVVLTLTSDQPFCYRSKRPVEDCVVPEVNELNIAAHAKYNEELNAYYSAKQKIYNDWKAANPDPPTPQPVPGTSIGIKPLDPLDITYDTGTSNISGGSSNWSTFWTATPQ